MVFDLSGSEVDSISQKAQIKVSVEAISDQ